MSLVRFDNGKWVDPDTVISVLAEDRVKGENPLPPRVIIKKLDDEEIILTFKTMKRAIMAADAVAEIVNGYTEGGDDGGGQEVEDEEEEPEGNLVKFKRVIN